MTLADARAKARVFNCTIRSDGYGEYRVCRRGAPEAEAYYTNDLEDAVGTAEAINTQHRGI